MLQMLIERCLTLYSPVLAVFSEMIVLLGRVLTLSTLELDICDCVLVSAMDNVVPLSVLDKTAPRLV